MTKAQQELWAAIQRSAAANRCKCPLQPAMNRAALARLGGGCTMPSYCCPTLDAYRRRVPNAPVEVEDPGWKPEQSQIRRTG